MGSIGGYLGWEFPVGQEYHDRLLRLNTGRNAFEYILRLRKYTKIYLPYYSCDALLEPVKKRSIDYVFYHIDDQLDPVIDFEIGDGECLLYVNYFGVKNDTAARLSREVRNLVIDNSQSFFSRPIPGIDTFYSCRKFFGVPNGAYVYMDVYEPYRLPVDTSFDSCTHLLKYVDCGIESAYADFQANEQRLAGQEVKQMSLLTQAMMSAASYSFACQRRNDNFQYLHERLAEINELKLNFSSVNGPLHYPLLIPGSGLRKLLLDEKIFVAEYWPAVRTWAGKDTYEHYLTDHLLALPIDQRYEQKDMDRIVENIFKFL